MPMLTANAKSNLSKNSLASITAAAVRVALKGPLPVVVVATSSTEALLVRPPASAT